MCVFKDCSGMAWRLGLEERGWPRLTRGLVSHSFNLIYPVLPSFTQPLSAADPEKLQCLDERYRRGPGEWESAGLRARREN